MRPVKGVLQRIDAGRWRKIGGGVLDSEYRPVASSFTLQWLRAQPQILKSTVRRVLFPAGYPDTVHVNYLPFAIWNGVQMVFSSAVGVFSTQSLLYGLGVGSGNALALSATINWILKDGLGQLGGIAVVAYLGGRFDSQAKRYRFLSAWILQGACLMELLVPMAPNRFLLWAAAANMMKNVAWMASSATRAQIHRHLAKGDNLGDLSGRAAAQNTLASLIGTGLGVVLSTVFLKGQLDMLTSVAIFLPLSLISLYASYKSCQYAISPKLTLRRIEIICAQLFPELLGSKKIKVNELVVDQLERYIQSSDILSRREAFTSWTSRREVKLLGALGKVQLEIEPELKDARFIEGDDRPYWIRVSENPNAVSVWFSTNATEAELLEGIIAAQLWRYCIGSGVLVNFEEVQKLINELYGPLTVALLKRGWDLKDIHLGPRHPLLSIK
jgi:hypothetical protein